MDTSAPEPERPMRGRALVAILFVGCMAALLAVLGHAAAPAENPGGGRAEQLGATGAAPRGPTEDAVLLWGDEFEGDRLDRRIWQANRYGRDGADAPFVEHMEAAWFSPENVAVEGGLLSLTVRAEPLELEGRRYPYSSGVVQARDEVLLRPGVFVEARISVPRCDGCWPAFWAVPNDRWPPEVDVFEYFGTHLESRPSFNYHAVDGVQSGPRPYGDRDVDYREGFHVYGLLWDGTTAMPYLDGEPYPRLRVEDVTDLPLMLILNLSVQAGHRPEPGAQMLVDWVRVWRP